MMYKVAFSDKGRNRPSEAKEAAEKHHGSGETDTGAKALSYFAVYGMTEVMP
jgi:hypothetical protein